MRPQRALWSAVIIFVLFVIGRFLFEAISTGMVEAALAPVYDVVRNCSYHITGQAQYPCFNRSSTPSPPKIPHLAKTYSGQEQDKNESQAASSSDFILTVNSQEQETINTTITYHINGKDYQYSCNTSHITNDGHIANFTCNASSSSSDLGSTFDFKDGFIKPDGTITATIYWSDGRNYLAVLTPD